MVLWPGTDLNMQTFLIIYITDMKTFSEKRARHQGEQVESLKCSVEQTLGKNSSTTVVFTRFLSGDYW